MESSHPLATPPATRETHDCGIRRKLSVHIGVPPESSPPGGTRGAAGPAAAEAGREAINDYFLAGQVAVTLNGQCCLSWKPADKLHPVADDQSQK